MFPLNFLDFIEVDTQIVAVTSLEALTFYMLSFVISWTITQYSKNNKGMMMVRQKFWL